MKEDVNGMVYDNENRKMLGPHASLCVHASGDTSYCGTNAYITRYENDHYVYHNAAMTTAIPNRCSQLLENARPTRKRAQKVCKLTGGSIGTCVEISTHPINCLG